MAQINIEPSTTANSDAALSGGLLVVLGILVALGIVYFAWGDSLGLRSTSQHITIETPSAPAAAPAPAAPAAQ